MAQYDYQSILDYAEALKRVSLAAQNEVNTFFDTLDLTNPAAARDSLLEFVAAVVAKYSPVAGQLALERFELLRTEQFEPGWDGVVVDPPLPAEAQAPVRAAADGLFLPTLAAEAQAAAEHPITNTPETTRSAALGVTDQLITNQARKTTLANAIADNERSHSRRVKFARIPTGPTTCAWCSMLAGLGWHYRSTAAALAASHNHCDCVVEPSWEAVPDIPGYDSEQYVSLYRDARAAVNPADVRSAWQDLSAEERANFVRHQGSYYADGTFRYAKRDQTGSIANFEMKQLLAEMRRQNPGLH